jgi:hypothetical protein
MSSAPVWVVCGAAFWRTLLAWPRPKLCPAFLTLPRRTR